MAELPDPDGVPDCLRLTRRGAVGLLQLHRPAKRNALDDATIAALHGFFAAPPAELRAVVLHGAGAHFCAGLDLSELTSRSVIEGIAHSRAWHRAFEQIQFGAVPVVALLHGAVVGGGLELAAAAHVRVAERTAFYALPEASRGIYVGGGGSVRLPPLIGTARVMDMMLTGRTLGAEEGQAIGLTQYLVDEGEGLAKGMELVDAVRDAKAYVSSAIAAADQLKIGSGRGPLHHFSKWW